MIYMRLLAGLLILGTSPAFCATMPIPTVPVLDPIGTGCINGGGPDDPFPASKGVRAPAFCIFNPCDRSLTRVELGRDIIGREVENWEWDAYYSRYAEICRADAVNRNGPSKPVTAEEFWAPLISGPPTLYLASAAGPVGSTGPISNPNAGSGSGFVPGAGGGVIFPGGGNGSEGGGTSPGGGGGSTTPGGGNSSGGNGGGHTPGGEGGSGGPDTPLPVIPLPATWALLMSAILAAMAIGKVRRP